MNSDTSKTLIGVLASHDDPTKNLQLQEVLTEAIQEYDLLENFRLVFTGGTYRRLFRGDAAKGDETRSDAHRLTRSVVERLSGKVIRLAETDAGGVAILSCLVSQRKVSILWPFFSPITTHLLFPENLALLRLADQWRVKKLMNTASVRDWLGREAERDKNLNRQEVPLGILLPASGGQIATREENDVLTWKNDEDFSLVLNELRSKSAVNPLDSLHQRRVHSPDDVSASLRKATIALISHDEMKSRMLEFVLDYEYELGLFDKIIATGTTGSLVMEAVPSLSVMRYHSGPKGGDVEIATEILFGHCHVVIFFVDPLRPHPHAEDIRVVFGACMIKTNVRMLSNEFQARDWMDRTVRGT